MSKILIVEGRLSSGSNTYAGKQKMVQWLGNIMSIRNHDITFCTVYDNYKSEKMYECTTCIPLRMHYYRSFAIRNIVFFCVFPFKIFKILKHKQYNYIISFGDTSYFILVWMCKIFHYKLIVSERNDPYHYSSILDKWKRGLYKYSWRIVFQTDGAKNYFKTDVQNKSIVIPNPVIIPATKWEITNSNKEIACVGRIHFWQKRQDLICYAFANVCYSFPDWKLNFYGSGPDSDKLKQLIIKLGIENKVTLHGAVKDINEKLLKNRIFVLPSDFEGIPNALLEAMALGMPVIATDCSPGGARLLINNGQNGLLVPINDKLALSEALKELMSCSENRLKFLGDNARVSVSYFNEDSIADQWDSIFSQ